MLLKGVGFCLYKGGVFIFLIRYLLEVFLICKVVKGVGLFLVIIKGE